MKYAALCKGVTKTFGSGAAKVNALRGVDLEVKPGELLMIVGPSGSGKTTLISVISAVLTQDSGECLVSGHDLNHEHEHTKTVYRGKHIGFVFQLFNLIPMLNGIENVSLPLIINGMDESKAQRRAKELLEQVGLKERMYALPSEMSGGEQQRVAIARSCIHEPSLIVCDEPTSALDHETGVKVLRIFKKIALTNKSALVIVTHDQRIFEFADRIVHMEDGQIIHEHHNHNHSSD